MPEKEIYKSSLTVIDRLFPKKYAKLFLILYIVLIPFFAGHLFLFAYISKFNFDMYSEICSKNGHFLTWFLGYEGFALFFLLIMLIAGITKCCTKSR